jgi:DNA-binding beta-propeller fold protein YncE
VQTVALPSGSQPFGIVFASAANAAFVALEGRGAVLKLDGTTGETLGSLTVGPNPRHLAIDGAGTNLYVSRFVTPPQPGEETAIVGSQIGGNPTGGEVLVVDADGMTVLRTIVLRHSDKLDAENQGGGVPNYLGAVAISPDGTSAIVPSKQDNIARGTLRSGANLTFQNTVRAISSRIDLVAGAEDYAHRMDHDNSSVASAAVFDPNGIFAFVALETSREVAVIDAYASRELFRFDVGRAPQGLAISQDGLRLYVSNFMDRTLGIFDIGALVTNAQWSVTPIASRAAIATEKLPAAVLAGKQLFYDARDPRLARDSYMSCAACHSDGGLDGRTWDLTGMGEGLRNTINLRGPGAAQGRLHWSSNFDEVQDFEGQIRALSGGTGLMTDADFTAGTRSQPLGDPKAGLSADLDALAAYVASLNQFGRSPNRNTDGSLTTAALAGRDVFRRENCAACHSGTAFTDSSTNVLHDIGTLKPTSGSRLGGPLPGIDTPTLRDTWKTAPYLHDGSAATLDDAIKAHAGVALTTADLTSLVAYVGQIDALEPAAPLPNAAPSVATPGNESLLAGQSLSVQIVASDADGDPLTYSASGLPAGLTIGAATGLISGTTTAVGTSTVLVSVSDGLASASTSFTISVLADTVAPTKPGTPTAIAQTGKPYLTWSASTDNVGVEGYIIYRSSTSSVPGTEVGRSTTTSFRDADGQRSRVYYYAIEAYDAAGNRSGRSGVAMYSAK